MSGRTAKIEFWYDFASTYSYLSAMRIEALAGAAGVAVEWRPFLLGPIFAAQGWTPSPFNLYPAKGRNMVRDIERLAAARGLRFVLPAKFPQNSLMAARLALVGAEEDWIAPLHAGRLCGRVCRRRRHLRPRPHGRHPSELEP